MISFKITTPIAACVTMVTVGLIPRMGAQPQEPPTEKAMSGPVSVLVDPTSIIESLSPAEALRLTPEQATCIDRINKLTQWPSKVMKIETSGGLETACGVRLDDGMVIAISNPTKTGINVASKAPVGKGLITVDRYVFSLEGPCEPAAPKRIRLTLNERPSSLELSDELPAAHCLIYRFTNRLGAALAARRKLGGLLSLAKASAPEAYRRMKVPLNEADMHLSMISGGIRSANRYDCTKHIQRAVLTTAHAEAICQNSVGLKRINLELGRSLLTSLQALESALSDLSASCLGLVPEVTLANRGELGNSASQVTVELRNSGAKPVTHVRLGATASPGLILEPNREAMFASLLPGQRVSATFVASGSPQNGLPLTSADISFITSRVPARLRVPIH